MTIRPILLALAGTAALAACDSGDRSVPTQDYVRCDAVGATYAGSPYAKKTANMCERRIKEEARAAEGRKDRWYNPFD